MTEREQVQASFIELIGPFVRGAEAREIGTATHLIDDLNVNSARLVDIVLETEERFGIAIDDESADRLQTIGDAVDMILEKQQRQTSAAAAD
jgi:acyl carrier protein